jgi:Sushi repeat (SCR repeat)
MNANRALKRTPKAWCKDFWQKTWAHWKVVCFGARDSQRLDVYFRLCTDIVSILKLKVWTVCIMLEVFKWCPIKYHYALFTIGECAAPNVVNGKFTAGNSGKVNFTSGDIVEVICDAGYKFTHTTGPKVYVVCRNDGSWDDPLGLSCSRRCSFYLAAFLFI